MLKISYSVLSNDKYSEGSECVSEEGIPGTCVDIHRCMQYVQELKHRSKPKICSFKGEIPIVCCTDCELINDTRNVLVDPYGLHYFKTGNKADDKCLQYSIEEHYACSTFGGMERYLDHEQNCYRYTHAQTRWAEASNAIAGGVNAAIGQYPHMALLGYGEVEASAEWLCGGTLISHRYILTAAHCESTHHLGPVRYIALGIHRRSDPPGTWKLYNVESIIIHPEYKPPSKYHDVALLLTDKRVRFNPLILPACLDTGDTDGMVAYATGWGSLDSRKNLADTLQTVPLKAYSEEECSSFYPPHRLLLHGYNHTTQMCYGDKDEINDTCQGDSGGPLQVTSKFSACVYTVIGVTSHGKSCSFGGGFGVYNRVSYYVPWIEQIVWPE
ncbi:hypothetical protein PYW08_012501 [Mythimna loreyi]|uniref:Uncharacterized protein n=1 Tax=Mythimna loreyi TaxID=667449 RepID=A0ACC2Q3Z1_9NEOP|nr:hypothetical protein PYW08_012501 [Mythimna loreyi]